jgi:predicted translin family RNA/ssDNA-binding protein
VDLSEGDLRKSTNLLQTVSKVYKELKSVEQVHEITGVSINLKQKILLYTNAYV